MAATLTLSDATPLELPRGLKQALLASGLFGLFSSLRNEEPEAESGGFGCGVLLHGAPLPGCTLLVLDGFAPPAPAHGGGGHGALSYSPGEGGRASAASALASLLTGSGETARFLRAQSRVTLTSSGSPPASAAFGVLSAAPSVVDGSSFAPPRLPPLSPLAACPGAPIAVCAVVHAGSEASVRARIGGQWIRLSQADGSGALATLPSLPPRLQGVVLLDGGDADGAAAVSKPRPLLLCHDGRIVAEVAAAEAALPLGGADSPQRDAVEDAVTAIGCALAAGAPIQAAAIGACHAVARGWLAAADACCRAVVAAAASSQRPAPRACALGPNRLSLLHAAVATANPAMVERVLRCARDARAAYGRSDAGDVLGTPATPVEAAACVGVTPLHMAVAVASYDGGARCAAALLGAARGGGASSDEEEEPEWADGYADAALAWARFPDGRGVTPSAACRSAVRRAQPSPAIEALARLDAQTVAAVDDARPIAAAALAPCLQRRGRDGAARYAFGGSAARNAAAEAGALVRSLLDGPPPPVAGGEAPAPARVLRVASASLRAAWSSPPSFNEAAAAAALHPLARYAFLLCLLAAPVLRMLRQPDAALSNGQQAVWRAALADSTGIAAVTAPAFAGAALALCILLPSLRSRVYERSPTATVACAWTLAFVFRPLCASCSPAFTTPGAPHTAMFDVSAVGISFMAACAPMRATPLAWLLSARFAVILFVTSRFSVSCLHPAAFCGAHAAALGLGWAVTAVSEALARLHHIASHPQLAGPAARCVAAFRAAAWPLGGEAGQARPVWVSKALSVPSLLWSALFPGGAATRAAFAADVAATGNARFARTFMVCSLAIDSLMCFWWVCARFFQPLSVAAATAAILAGPQPLSHASMQRVMLSEPLWAAFPVAFLPYFCVFSPIRAVRSAYARPRVRAAVLAFTAVVRFFFTDVCSTRLVRARVGASTPFLLPCTSILFETCASAMIAAMPMPAPVRVALLLSRGLLPMLPQSWGVWIAVVPRCFTAGRMCVSPHAVRCWSLAAIVAVVVRSEAASIRAFAARRQRRAQLKTE